MNITAPNVSHKICLTLLAALPVVPLFAPWQMFPVTSFHQEWLAVAFGLLACLSAWPLLRNTAQLALPVTVWLPLFLALFILVQSALLPQVVAEHAGMAIAYLLWAALLMVLAGLLRQTLGREYLGLWLSGGLLAAAVWASGRELLARLTGEAGVWGGIGQPNLYGDLLALGGTSLLYIRAAGKLRHPAVILLGLIVALGLSLTPSRTVWLYWAALAVTAWRIRPDWLRPLLLGFMAYLVFQAMWTVVPLPAAQTIAAERLLQQVSGASPRWHIWQVAWQLFGQHPLLGHGFGQFDWAYFQAGRFLSEQPTRIEHAHNLILHLLAELGALPVMLVLLAMFQWLKPWLMAAAGTEKSNAEVAAERPAPTLRAWLLMLAAVIGIHSMLEYPLWFAPFLGIAALLLGVGEQRFWRVPLSKTGSALTGVLVSLALAVAVVHEGQYLRMEIALLAGMAQPSQQREQNLVAVCQEIPDTAPLLLPYVPVLFTLTGHPESAEMRAGLKTLAEAAVRFTPSSNLVYRLALMQALNGEKTGAMATLNRALDAYPQGASKFLPEVMRLKGEDGSNVAELVHRLVSFVNRTSEQGRSAFPRGSVGTRYGFQALRGNGIFWFPRSFVGTHTGV
jgi:O-antigen ligase